MATIYRHDNMVRITTGIQGSDTSDEAKQAAQRLAAMFSTAMVIEDDGDYTLVSPDGDVCPMSESEADGWWNE